jgi:hypothetical protein
MGMKFENSRMKLKKPQAKFQIPRKSFPTDGASHCCFLGSYPLMILMEIHCCVAVEYETLEG